MAGLWFDEFRVGQAFEHEIRRTVTEADNVWFCGATYNPAALHIDAEYCKGTEFGRPLVNSIFTLGLVIGLSVQDTTLGTTVANLGMTDVRFPSPVFHGDTLRSKTSVLEVRESKSRPNAGIVTFLHQGFNQRGEEVVSCKRQALMLKRPHLPAASGLAGPDRSAGSPHAARQATAAQAHIAQRCEGAKRRPKPNPRLAPSPLPRAGEGTR